MSKICKVCGAEMADSTVFCTNCGSRFELPEAAPAPVAETPVEAPTPEAVEAPAMAPVEAPVEAPAPEPVAAAPVEPTPVAPVAPVEPTPVAPAAPVYTAPVAPTPVAPVAPTPVAPTPVAPTPAAPAYTKPVAPTPVAPVAPAGARPVYTAPVAAPVDPKTAPGKPFGTAGFFWMLLVYNIPVIGFFVDLICCFAAKNRSFKNFSRAIMIWWIVFFIIGLVTFLVLLLLGKTIFGGAINLGPVQIGF